VGSAPSRPGGGGARAHGTRWRGPRGRARVRLMTRNPGYMYGTATPVGRRKLAFRGTHVLDTELRGRRKSPIPRLSGTGHMSDGYCRDHPPDSENEELRAHCLSNLRVTVYRPLLYVCFTHQSAEDPT